MSLHTLTPILFIALLLLGRLSYVANCIPLSIAIRWARWAAFALGVAFLLQAFEWSTRPFWVLATMGLLAWFLLETLYSWLLIQNFNRSPSSFFPILKTASAKRDWPLKKNLLKLHGEISDTGFQKVASFKSWLNPEFCLRGTLWTNAQKTHRLQVTFVPLPANRIQVFFALNTQLPEDKELITDNIPLPFGGYYPKKWLLKRLPLSKSFKRLFKYHQKRLKSMPEPIACDVPKSDWIQFLNARQHDLESLNLKAGFLQANAEAGGQVQLSPEGCYRLWKSLLLMSYFGLAWVSYMDDDAQ